MKAHTMLLAALLLAEAGGKPVDNPVKLQEPLRFGRDLVEVTSAGTLRRCYRVWGDWAAEQQAYLAEARENAKARGTPARRVKMGCIFLKDAQITFTNIPGADGKPLTGSYSTPPEFSDAMKQRGMREYCDFMFAFSRGELEVEWVTATLTNLHWVSDAPKNPAWSCQPKAVGDDFLKALAKFKDDGVCMWMLCAGRPTTLNGGAKQKIGAPPFGISYTQWPIFGGYSLVISAPDVGLMVHEFNHRYLDNLRTLENIQLTQFHGLANLGYEDKDLGYPHLMNTYRSIYLYIVRRDMWRRFTVTTPNHSALEPFSGKAYAWAEVQGDCWFKLPQLGDAELAKLTGLATFKMDAQPKKTYRLYTVGEAERAKILSPYTAQAGEQDTALNNLLALHTESAAVLKTATGHWLFVRPDLADVYVDMFKLAGRAGGPLPVYGYVLEGVRPLLVLRAPPELPVPANELGYVRPADRSEIK